MCAKCPCGPCAKAEFEITYMEKAIGKLLRETKGCCG